MQSLAWLVLLPMKIQEMPARRCELPLYHFLTWNWHSEHGIKNSASCADNANIKFHCWNMKRWFHARSVRVRAILFSKNKQVNDLQIKNDLAFTFLHLNHFLIQINGIWAVRKWKQSQLCVLIVNSVLRNGRWDCTNVHLCIPILQLFLHFICVYVRRNCVSYHGNLHDLAQINFWWSFLDNEAFPSYFIQKFDCSFIFSLFWPFWLKCSMQCYPHVTQMIFLSFTGFALVLKIKLWLILRVWYTKVTDQTPKVVGWWLDIDWPWESNDKSQV